ncbi:helix-turn-helix domain-containing protein [Paraburkholderia hospita]|uniref:helix-turn-helix domain-containing protein n=1 Tax=Paraburkholderia hospita TaxID=169430 RepID=UPI0008A7F010|nr:helix-turn-helix transcriptional regulator [Paraburkholderia hospita]SEI14462.1 Helix-turn-helix [Paraburkholderia hospita]
MATETKPLTLLKAYRIVNNLDTTKICVKADISRPYLTRLEQGAIPSPEIAERLVKVLKDQDCARVSQPSAQSRRQQETKIEMMESARHLVSQTAEKHPEFARDGIREIHLLYPARFQEGVA